MRNLSFSVRNKLDGYGLDLDEVLDIEQPDDDEPQYAVKLQMVTPDIDPASLEGCLLLDYDAAVSLRNDLIEFLKELD